MPLLVFSIFLRTIYQFYHLLLHSIDDNISWWRFIRVGGVTALPGSLNGGTKDSDPLPILSSRYVSLLLNYKENLKKNEVYHLLYCI